MRLAGWGGVVALLVALSLGAYERVHTAAGQKHEMSITGTK